MKLIHSIELRPEEALPDISSLLESVDEAQLRGWVERFAKPRHFTSERAQNEATASWLAETFQSWGFQVQRQGDCSNILALPKGNPAQVLLIGAHYDSVPNCPGADDNASAVAALLGCARACRQHDPALPAVFVAFNREEDDLFGSRDFVKNYLLTASFRVRCAHILEMVGFASAQPGSQQVPTGLPIQISDRGDFLGLLANRASGSQMETALRQARTYVAGLEVTGLEVEQGFERVFPVLARSDHVPFWTASIPAIMWTDTAEFRNPNYHRPSDTPETLDYGFLRRVTQVLTATVVEQIKQVAPSEFGHGSEIGDKVPDKVCGTKPGNSGRAHETRADLSKC